MPLDRDGGGDRDWDISHSEVYMNNFRLRGHGDQCMDIVKNSLMFVCKLSTRQNIFEKIGETFAFIREICCKNRNG